MSKGSRVLGVGCGRGLNVCALALKGFEVYSVDVSGEALEIASRLAHKLGVEAYFK